MKAILEFDMDKEDGCEREEYETYLQAPQMASVLWDMSQYLRELNKYGHSFKSIEEAIDKIREEFYNLCDGLKEGSI